MQVYLRNGNIPTSTEEVESALKRHEAFEKVLEGQDEKLKDLNYSAQQLHAQNHFDSENILHVVEEVAER